MNKIIVNRRLREGLVSEVRKNTNKAVSGKLRCLT